jgi:HD-GYP domain-containing protein (c-di-GMP phosphodiesterase class II)
VTTGLTLVLVEGHFLPRNSADSSKGGDYTRFTQKTDSPIGAATLVCDTQWGFHMPATASDLDPELLQEFTDDLEERRVNCSSYLLALENNPEDEESLRLLFRDVHSVKGNLGMMDMPQYLSVLQAIEDILDAMRHHQFICSSAIDDVLLLGLDYAYNHLRDFIRGVDDNFNAQEYQHIASLIAAIPLLEGDARNAQIRATIQALAPETHAGLPPRNEVNEQELEAELVFFQRLSLAVDQRSEYWQGRTTRTYDVALAMNKRAGNPLNELQLKAAIYLHDLGMGFIHSNTLHKSDSLNNDEWQQIRHHVDAVVTLVKPFREWQEAVEIISQHHERLDGSGYPNGLKGDAICSGARLLAIIDTYEAILHRRAYQAFKQRPIVRAVMEINNQAGVLFCPIWVEHFNAVIREMHIRH